MPLSLQLNIFSFFLMIAAVAVLTISVLLIRRDALPSKIFGIMLAVVGIWAAGYALELTSQTLDAMLLWINVEYIGIALIPALWFLFSLSYSGHDDWITPKRVIALFVLPIVTLLMVWTNDLHYLHYSQVGVDTTSGPFPLLDFTPGPWYWVHTFYFYVLLIWGTYLILQNYRYADPLFKKPNQDCIGWCSDSLGSESDVSYGF